MMVVLVLIGLLAGLVTVSVRHYLVTGKQQAARAQIASLKTAAETFYSVYGRYPTNDEGLDILTQRTDQLPEPLLAGRTVPNDPWGRPYQYNSPGREEPYEIISYGADGRQGGEGGDADVESWQLSAGGGDDVPR
jgi:general secretion pathway protein G